jgi:hypothetical protein
MAWMCPKCHRRFKNPNQAHSCVRENPGDQFLKSEPHVKAIYNKLLREIRKFGPVNISPVRIGIMLKNESTFVAIKARKQFLDIEFLLPVELNEFPIHKTFRVSKQRVAHFIRLESPDEITKQILGWLKESYRLTGK